MGPMSVLLVLKSKEAVVKDGAMNMEERSKRCNVVGSEDGRRGHKPRNVGSF